MDAQPLPACECPYRSFRRLLKSKVARWIALGIGHWAIFSISGSYIVLVTNDVVVGGNYIVFVDSYFVTGSKVTFDDKYIVVCGDDIVNNINYVIIDYNYIRFSRGSVVGLSFYGA